MKKKSQNNSFGQIQDEALLDYIDLMLDKDSPDGKLCGNQHAEPTPAVSSASNNGSRGNKVIPISSLLPSATVDNDPIINKSIADNPKTGVSSFVDPEKLSKQDFPPARKMPRLLAKFERLLKASLDQQNQNPLVYTPIDPHELLVRERVKRLTQEIQDRHQKTTTESAQSKLREEAPITREVSPPPVQVRKTSSLQQTQGSFDCLQFHLMGLKLALPLAEVKDIFPVSERLNQLSIESEQFLSLKRPDGSEIPVVNTPLLILPERYDDSFLDQIKYVITINAFNWGIAVDEINQAITLDSSEVRWRTSGGKRSWIAGTVVDLMCTLVDTNAMAELFDQDDLNLKV